MTQKGAKYQWRFDEAPAVLTEEIRRAAGVSPVMAQTLASRQVASGKDAVWFLDPESRPLPDARLLPDADRVVERVAEAVSSREPIVVHGHDDADGVTATVIMLEALEQVGTAAGSYIPDRRTEGHGLSLHELDYLAGLGTRLVITVDSCVSDRDAIAYGNSLGIDTIVTDHHEIPPQLPPAHAIVNPKLPTSSYPYRYLAGTGVALRVADLLLDALRGRFGPVPGGRGWYGPRWREEAAALAAVGSIADKVPLTGDNRSIVAAGLKALPATERPGLRALLEESRLWGREPDPEDVRESLGPIFGRVSDGRGGNDALGILLAADVETAREGARALVGERVRWKDAASGAMGRVRPLLEAEVASDAPFIIVEVPVPVDVMGYVASRLADEADRPVVVMAPRGGAVAAEARGPQGFNLVAAFHSMSELFVGYGGHPRAAGFTMAAANTGAFRDRMLDYVRANPPAPEPRKLDAVVPISAATPALAAELERLKPFGLANPPATLLSPDTTRDSFKEAAARGIHLSMPLRLGPGAAGVVYRLRSADGIALASIVDTIEPEAS
jgi:single-stranded-DNA-specific exonuclease